MRQQYFMFLCMSGKNPLQYGNRKSFAIQRTWFGITTSHSGLPANRRNDDKNE